MPLEWFIATDSSGNNTYLLSTIKHKNALDKDFKMSTSHCNVSPSLQKGNAIFKEAAHTEKHSRVLEERALLLPMLPNHHLPSSSIYLF